ncbi:MAG: DNA polymerase III subunit beta [Bacillota bacterium]|nr:DNA polymerase III subunit beta [Bacillota bacterium]
MIFQCQKEELLNILNIVSKAVSPRAAMPILEGIYIKAQAECIKIVGNDNELGIECTLPAQVYEEGSIVLIAKTFIDIIRRLPNDTVTVKVSEDRNAIITCQNIEYKIIGLSDDEYPLIPEIEPENSFKIESEKLKSMIRRTLFATSQNESRMVLTGSLFEVKDNYLTVVSVDGFRLALRNESVKNGDEKEFSFIIPGKTLGELVKILEDDDSIVNVSLTQRYVMLKTEDAKVVSRLIEGAFLNYNKTIPVDSAYSVVIPVNSVLESVERCEPIIAADDAKSPVRLIFTEKELIVKCIAATGQIVDIIPVPFNGEELEIGFNHKYLRDALKACETDLIKLEFNSNLSPCLLKPIEGEGFLQMVLPVRLKNDN